MKLKIALTVLMILFSANANAFYTGRTTESGASLKDYLKPEALHLLTKKPNPTISIIDVRPLKAYEKGHIPTAKSFPSGEIMDRLNELPKDHSYIIYCETGIRAQMVLNKLKKKEYKKLMNWGGYKRWPYPLIKSK